jgi:hypothetical protein
MTRRGGREDENEEAIRTDEGKAGWRRNETVRTREQARGGGHRSQMTCKRRMKVLLERRE